MSGELQWFLCLFGNVRRSDGASAAKSTNRTVIVMTLKPCALLTLMNASTENYIADAAEKASQLLHTKCERICSSMPESKRFDFLCVLGPISDVKVAKKITRKWIQSRGGPPRTTRAQQLAERYNIDFVPNPKAVYGLNNLDVDVKVLESAEGRATLEISLKKST